jgi:hypothetical protein
LMHSSPNIKNVLELFWLIVRHLARAPSRVRL